MKLKSLGHREYTLWIFSPLFSDGGEGVTRSGQSTQNPPVGAKPEREERPTRVLPKSVSADYQILNNSATNIGSKSYS